MKKRIYRIAFLFMVGLCAGCGKEGTVNDDLSMESQFSQVEEGSASAGKENDGIEWKDRLEIDFSYDYSEDIKTDVGYMVSN